jgi:hypothetical protein
MWDAATSLYKPATPGAGSASDLTGTPLLVSAANGGTGAYPVRPATTRPVLFRGAIPPASDGSTAGTGGIVVGLDEWIYWTSGSNSTIPDGAVTPAKFAAGALVDDTTNLSTATPSSTVPWSANQSKTQILGVINDASTTATNRVWSVAKTKAYVDANAGGTPGGSIERYEIPASSLSYPASNATEAVKLAAINANTSTVTTALTTHPDMLVVLPPGKPVLMQVNLDEIFDTSFPAGQNYAIAGPVAIARGTRTSATDVSTGRIVAAPPIRVARKGGAYFAPVNLRNTVQIGPNLPNAGSVFTSICSGFEVASGYNKFKSGQIIHLCSNDSYDWAARAGYSFVGKASFFPVAGILITINSLSYTALDAQLATQTPARDSNGSLERFTIVGATSGATAIVAGDIAGVNQVVVDNVSADFTAGETLRESTTNAIVGTFGSATVCMSGLLNTTYPTTPQMRILTRSYVDISRLRISPDGDPDDLIQAWNRTDCASFVGCTDVDFRGVEVNNGYAAGIVTRSCWNVVGDIECHALPNHAIEAKNTDGTSDTKRSEGAYGYVWRALGCTDHFDVKVVASFARHAVTSNGIGATWNQNSRTGSSAGSPDLSTNYWNHGPGGRNGRVTGIARSMIATGWDTHEGAEDWLFDTPMAIEPLSAAKSTTAPDGATFRGFNLTLLNPYFDGVRLGVSEQGIALSAGGLVWQNRILGGVMKNLQLGGYSQSEDADVDAESSFLIKGTTFHCNPAIPSTVYAQYAVLLRRSNTRIEDVRVESCNDRFFRFTSFVGTGSTGAGRASLHNISIDFTNSTASRIFSLEATYASVTVAGAHALVNPVAGSQKPFFWFTNSGGNTPVKYRGLTAESLSTTTAIPALQQTTAGTPTFTYLTSVGEPTGGGTSGTQVSVDGANVATLDISSVPAVQVLTIDTDLPGPTAGTTVANLSQFQTALPIGTWLLEADLLWAMSATGGGTLRFGFGGSTISGASITNVTSVQYTNTTAPNTSVLNALVAGGATAVTTAGSANVAGLSPAVVASLPQRVTGKLTVTAAGTYGLIWQTSNGATATGTLKAGSSLKITRIS